MADMMEWLAENLSKYKSILLIAGVKGITENLEDVFCSSETSVRTAEKLLILSDRAIGYEGNGNWEYRRLNEEDMNAIQKLYATYDFSDCFQVLSASCQYGTILNYVETGLMTMEEVGQCFIDRR